MSTQLRDGTWTPIEDFPEALDTFHNALKEGIAKRFVVGTVEEIQEEQENFDLEKQIRNLRSDVEEIKARSHTGMIILPTDDEIRDYRNKI